MTTPPPAPTETAIRGWLPAAAGAVAGTTAWTTRAAFDLVGGDGAPIRVAMLPPTREAIGLVLAGALLAVAATRLLQRLVPEADRSRRRPEHDAVAPLFFSGILVVPYLPVLPDLWPAVTALAGPAKYVVWALIFAMTARAVWRQLAGDGCPTRTLSTRMSVALVAAVSCVTFATAAWRLVGTVFPGGDEPHYLVIAQSLWWDGDLRIENNHERGDTLEYYPRRLAPHYLTRGADGEIYSVHPIGLPVLATPIYALLGYRGVVGWLVLVAAAASTVAWWLAFAVSGSRRAATLAWAAATLTAPFVFNSFTVYPEVPASLLVVLTYGLAAGFLGGRTGAWRWAACGVALAMLPWLSTKYVPMAGALGAVVLARLWWPEPQEAGTTMPAAGIVRRWRETVAVCVPPAISLIAWIAFFWTIWGNPWPSAPYGASSGTEARHLASGAPGLLLDQEYGLLVVAPVLWLALVGLARMVGERAARRTGCEVALVGLTLLSTVGAFHLWWGGSAAVGRPLIAAVPLLAIPLAWQVRKRSGDRALQAGYLVVLALSLANVVVAATQNRGLLLASGRDGASKILEWWSPWWPVTAIAPSFIVDPPVLALGYALVWLVPAWLVALGLRQLTLCGAGAVGLAALASTAAVAAAASIAAPQLLGSWMRPPARLEARTWSPLLDRFSPSRRPLAIEYRPFVRVAPDDVPRRFLFDARPDDDRPRPGMRKPDAERVGGAVTEGEAQYNPRHQQGHSLREGERRERCGPRAEGPQQGEVVAALLERRRERREQRERRARHEHDGEPAQRLHAHAGEVEKARRLVGRRRRLHRGGGVDRARQHRRGERRAVADEQRRDLRPGRRVRLVDVPDALHGSEDEPVGNGAGRRKDAHDRVRVLAVGRPRFGQPVGAGELRPDDEPFAARDLRAHDRLHLGREEPALRDLRVVEGEE